MPNPITNPGYYTDVRVGARTMPGYLRDIRGLKSAEEWVKQAGIGNVEALIWRKRPLIKGIEVEVGLNGETDDDTIAAFTAWYDFIKYLKPGGNPNAKPPAYTVTNTQFLGCFIKQIVYAGHVEPIFSLQKPMIGIVVFDEYRKPVAIPIGPPEAAKTDDTNPSPRTTQEADAASALAAARSGNPQ